MARQRFLWPSIWKDPVFGRLEPLEQIMFIGFFSIADDEGRLLADPAYIRSELFVYKDYANKKVQTIRDSVAEKCANVHLYHAGSVEYIALLKWSDYQKPKYPKASKIPPPFLQDSPKASGSLPPSGPNSGSVGRDGLDGVGMEGDGQGRKDTAADAAETAPSKSPFKEPVLKSIA